MVASINSNAGAASAQMGYIQAQASQNAAMSRINTGLRIQDAKDDAAGSTILTTMKSQFAGNVVAMRNTNDGVNLLKTATEGIKAIEGKVGRLRELAVQSPNAPYTGAAREAMMQEVKSLLKDINTLAEKTNFNGVKLLDGSFNNAMFQVGANVGDTKTVSMNAASATKMGSSDSSSISSRQNAGTNGLVEGAFSLNGVLIGPSLAAADTASTASAAASSIAKAAAVNAKSAQSGVTATVNATEVAGTAMTASVLAGKATINGVDITLNTTADAASTRAGVVAAINAKADQTGVTAVDTGSDKGGVKLVAADGRNVVLALATVTAASTGLSAAATYTGSFTLNSDKAISITSGKGSLSDTGGLKDSGLAIGTYNAQTAFASTERLSAGGANLTKIVAGDFTINGAVVGASLASSDTASYSYTSAVTGTPNSKELSGISKAAAVNALTSQTGVSATVNATQVDGNTSMTGAATGGALLINGVETAAIATTTDTAASRKAVVDAINAISGQTGVTALDTNDNAQGVRLSAADGRNITMVQKMGGNLTAAATGLNATTVAAAAGATPTGAELDAGTYTSTLTLSSAKAFSINAGSTDAGTAALNLKVGTYGAGRSGGSLDMIDLSTAEGAVAALTTIDNAIASLSATKASIGAIQKSFMATATDLAAQNSAIKASTDTLEQSDFISDSAELAASSLRAAASQYAFQKAIEAQGQLQGLMR